MIFSIPGYEQNNQTRPLARQNSEEVNNEHEAEGDSEKAICHKHCDVTATTVTEPQPHVTVTEEKTISSLLLPHQGLSATSSRYSKRKYINLLQGLLMDILDATEKVAVRQ